MQRCFKVRQLLTTVMIAGSIVTLQAQKIDFNKGGRPESEGLEPGYQAWVVNEAGEATETFDGITITLRPDRAYAGETVMTNYWKQGVTSQGAKLVGDAVVVYKNDHANITAGSTKLDVIIKGLSAGRHSLQAYHNNIDGLSCPPIAVYVNGEKTLEGIEQTVRKTKATESGQSFVEFNVGEGETVTVSYVSTPKDGEEYQTTTVTINALVFNEADSHTIATDPYPTNNDEHADADAGLTLRWKAAKEAAKHHVYFGTDKEGMTLLAATADTCITAPALTTEHTYYWRVDEEDAEGNVAKGETWMFRPRRLAFPDAEGYGRFAIGGRGGSVYHVTSLEDNPDSPQPGTLRYGITNVKGPRTIVFDVGGVIYLKARLTCSEKYVTVAGQTAPGLGIMLRGAPFGMQSDGITRFIRMRRGHILDSADANRGLDGLGMAGNDHAIMDHCSISWTIDEGFSSRNAKHVTLQRTLISEALNIADHPNYEPGKAHGFAATIGGGEMGAAGSSYHHNLLAHNEGRNWSISGGLDGNGYYDGHHDIFNNVVYNWGGRATDGGTHEGQFVGNYYKMGPATTQTFLLNAQIEGTGKGSQAYYVKGNIRENLNGTKTNDKQGDTYKYTLSGGQQLDWKVFQDTPFFESHANVQTAEEAYQDVLCDVGCNQPALDNHDERIISETLSGTTSTRGSVSHKRGLIDHEDDAGGYEALNIVEALRPEGWDTDEDGIPDWYEKLASTDPATPNNNHYREDGYTDLEDYLEWLAHPHYVIKPDIATTVDLAPLFAGMDNIAASASDNGTNSNVTFSIDGHWLTVEAKSETLCELYVTATDAKTGFNMTRRINFAFSKDGKAPLEINDIKNTDSSAKTASYDLLGRKQQNPKPGITIQHGRLTINQKN